MSNYTIDLSPVFTNIASEGGLDTSLLNGKSIQRTLSMIEVINNSCAPKPCRKMISVHDGDTYNDTTFQNKDGEGTFEAGGLTFTASQILIADGPYDQYGFIGVGAIIELTSEQADALNSYGYPSLFFSAIWQDGSEDTNANLYVFALTGMGQPSDTFSDIAAIAALDAELYPYCSEPTTWKMPVTTTGFLFGDNSNPAGFMQRRTSDPHVIYQLFKQVINQQEVDLEGKTPQEKANIIRTMLESLDDDHPLVANLRKR